MRATILLLALLIPAAASAAELKAGIARVEITPSTFMPMYGYANRKCGPANGTHDPLFAKALVLESGDSRMAPATAASKLNGWAPAFCVANASATANAAMNVLSMARVLPRPVVKSTRGAVQGATTNAPPIAARSALD